MPLSFHPLFVLCWYFPVPILVAVAVAVAVAVVIVDCSLSYITG
jgi:hypothetical protein